MKRIETATPGKKPDRSRRRSWGIPIAATTLGGLVTFGIIDEKCGPAPSQPVADGMNDGRCDEETESSPYLLDAKGRVRTDDRGQPIPNPEYSLDCHSGDNICQDGDQDHVRDAAGKLIPRKNLPTAYRDGRPINYPLESADPNSPIYSPDCILEKVYAEPCGSSPSDRPLKRPRLEEALGGMRQLTPGERIRAFEHPESLQPGNNYHLRERGRRETCDQYAPLCDPPGAEDGIRIEDDCYCPNHPDCLTKEQPHPPSGCTPNGKIDRGEECDPLITSRRRNPCASGSTCDRTCKCRPVVQSPLPEPTDMEDVETEEIVPSPSIIRRCDLIPAIYPELRGPASTALNRFLDQIRSQARASPGTEVILTFYITVTNGTTSVDRIMLPDGTQFSGSVDLSMVNLGNISCTGNFQVRVPV